MWRRKRWDVQDYKQAEEDEEEAEEHNNDDSDNDLYS